jgi:hypothetical protein
MLSRASRPTDLTSIIWAGASTRLFTGADRHGMEAIMCHAEVINRRQTMTHLGGPVEDVAR